MVTLRRCGFSWSPRRRECSGLLWRSCGLTIHMTSSCCLTRGCHYHLSGSFKVWMYFVMTASMIPAPDMEIRKSFFCRNSNAVTKILQQKINSDNIWSTCKRQFQPSFIHVEISPSFRYLSSSSFIILGILTGAISTLSDKPRSLGCIATVFYHNEVTACPHMEWMLCFARGSEKWSLCRSALNLHSSYWPVEGATGCKKKSVCMKVNAKMSLLLTWFTSTVY